MTGLDVEAVLNQHPFYHSRGYKKAACGEVCDWVTYGDEMECLTAHRAHVAAVLRVEIAEWLSSERAQDAVADAMLDCNHNGMRCYDPVPIYPTAQAALSALTASLAATEGDRQ